MDILIKSAVIIDQRSKHNGQKKDILIEKGKIVKIASAIKNEQKIKELSFPDLHVSIGWFDFRANFCDPGNEHKEDFNSGLKAAALGGFTGVLSMPDTFPPVDSKSGVEYLLKKTDNQLVDVFPTGCLSEKAEGKEIAEMYDMHQAGAVAFTDNKKSIVNPSLLIRAMLYSKAFNGLIMEFPNDKSIFNNGQINEGVTSTKLGIKGIPALAEELQVARAIYLAEYCDAAIHLTNISTQKSVELIKQAKAKGLKVTADVNSYHLLLDETALETFDSNYKVLPPLRTKDDQKALIKGLKEGTIDIICSDHTPENIENKKCEFDHAAFGIINLQTSFAVAHTAIKNKLSLPDFIEKLTVAPRQLLGITAPEIKENSLANLTLFSPNSETKLAISDIVSKSKNSPFIGKKLNGKVYGVINKNKVLVG